MVHYTCNEGAPMSHVHSWLCVTQPLIGVCTYIRMYRVECVCVHTYTYMHYWQKRRACYSSVFLPYSSVFLPHSSVFLPYSTKEIYTSFSCTHSTDTYIYTYVLCSSAWGEHICTYIRTYVRTYCVTCTHTRLLFPYCNIYTHVYVSQLQYKFSSSNSLCGQLTAKRKCLIQLYTQRSTLTCKYVTHTGCIV